MTRDDGSKMVKEKGRVQMFSFGLGALHNGMHRSFFAGLAFVSSFVLCGVFLLVPFIVLGFVRH